MLLAGSPDSMGHGPASANPDGHRTPIGRRVRKLSQSLLGQSVIAAHGKRLERSHASFATSSPLARCFTAHRFSKQHHCARRPEHGGNNQVRVPLAFLCVVVVACAGDPRDSALRFDRLSIAGDNVRMASMISRGDSEALAGADGEALRKSWSKPDAGSPGSTADSARVIRSSGDSAVVAVYRTDPNWASVGGRFRFSGTITTDRAESLGLVDRLPKVAGIDTVQLMRERTGLRRRWAIAFGLARQFQQARVLGPLFSVAIASDSPLVARAAAMHRYLAAAAKEGFDVSSFVTNDTADVFDGASMIDSLNYELRLEVPHYAVPLAGLPTRQLAGWVENRSHRPIERLVIAVRLNSGERGEARAYNVAPGARGSFIGLGDWKGQKILRQYITEIKPAR